MDEGSKDPVAPNGKAPQVIGVEINSDPVPFSELGYVCPVTFGATDIEVLVSIPDYVAVGITAEIVEGGGS
jgi:hypothetical protein